MVKYAIRAKKTTILFCARVCRIAGFDRVAGLVPWFGPGFSGGTASMKAVGTIEKQQAATGPVLVVGADCLLAGGSPLLIENLKGALTIDNPKYRDAKKYARWIGKNLPRKLYFFEMDADNIRFPRGFVVEAIGLCLKHMGQKPRIVDQRRRLPDIDLAFSGQLRPYQEQAVQDVLKHHFGVLVAGTGSGKTVMALAVVAARRQPTLILLHNKELLYQWATRVEEFLGQTPGLVGDGHYDIRPVTVAIVNTARKHLDELPAQFGQIIVDECHRVPASLFTDVVRAFDCMYSLGLSATAYRREDGLTPLIYLYMGENKHKVESRHLEEVGAVLRPEFVQRPTGFHYSFRGDYQALMTALTADEERNRQIAFDVVREAPKTRGTVLVVSDRVAHCERLAELVREGGLEVAVLTGRVAAEERTSIVEAVRQGRVAVLISTLQLVGEGFDVAGLSTLFLTTPIKFTGRLRQVIGRILRPAAGKLPKVIDYVDENIGVLRTSARIRQSMYF